MVSVNGGTFINKIEMKCEDVFKIVEIGGATWRKSKFGIMQANLLIHAYNSDTKMAIIAVVLKWSDTSI